MRRHFTDASLLFGSDVTARALNFLAMVWLARALQPDSYGLVVIAASVLEYAFLLSDWGLKTLGTRETAVPADQRRFQPSSVFGARLVLAAAVLIVAEIATSVLALDPPLKFLLRIYLLSVVPYSLLLDWYIQGRRAFGLLTISRMMQSAALLGGFALLVHSPSDAAIVPWIQLVAMSLAAGLLLALRPSGERMFDRPPNPAELKRILATSAALGTAAIFGQSFVVLPPIVVGRMLGTTEAGVLHAALRIVAVLLIVDRVFGTVYLPALASAWQLRGETTRDRLRAALRILVPLGSAIAMIGTIHAPSIMEIVYRNRYVAGAPALAIAAWFVPATLLNTFFGFGLIAIGKEKLYLRSGLRAGIAFVVLLVAATAAWGLRGTAGSIVTGEMLMTVMLLRDFRRSVVVALSPVLARSLAAAACVVAASYLAGTGSLWYVPLHLTAFLFLLVAVRGLGRNDVILLKSR